MLDELELVRRTLHDPPPDLRGEQRSRERLQQAITANRPLVSPWAPRKARRIRWLGLAAAIVVGLLVVQSVRMSDHTPERPAVSSALDPLSTAALSPDLAHRKPGSFLFSTSTDRLISTKGHGLAGNQGLSGGGSFDLSIRRRVETWLHADGSATRLVTITSVRFLTPQDRQAWRDMGQPTIPHAGPTPVQELSARALTPYDLSSLPTEVDPLIAALRAPSRGPGQLDDEQVAGQIVNILAYADPLPSLRSALIEALGRLNGITKLGDVTDPLGRPGVGFGIAQGSGFQEVIFDSKTSALLATIDHGPDGSRINSIVFQPPLLVSGLPARVRFAV